MKKFGHYRAHVRSSSASSDARQALAAEDPYRELDWRFPLESVAEPDVLARFVYPKAPLAERFAAYIVDTLVAVAPLIVAVIANRLFHAGTQSSAMRAINILATLVWALYYSCTKDARPNGQSIGKKLFGLMVVSTETNKPCSLRQAVGRGGLVVVLNVFPGLALLMESVAALVSDAGFRLGDLLVGTQVIRASSYTSGEG
jgi:uncharacterized RDD family membrane protein YckC